MSAADPTAFDLRAEGPRTDPLQRRVRGWSNHGGIALDMPFITLAADNLWHGGCETGLVLPPFIKHVVSLYPWERYTVRHSLLSETVVLMLDSEQQGFEQVEQLARWVNICRESGPVLVHCQAGINRSSLIVARALVLAGDQPSSAAAVAHMRAERSPGVLSNPAFERWVLGHDTSDSAA